MVWLIWACLACSIAGAAIAGSSEESSPVPVGWGPHGKKLYYFIVLSDAKPGMDAEFNRWYDRIHAPVMIESGDFVSAQRFAYSPVQLGGSELPKRSYMVLFTIETNDMDRVLADAKKRLGSARNVRGDAMDYKSLLSYTFEAVGPPISQRQARRILAEETAAGRVPAADPGAPSN
ncbi:MAG: hypothetical protein ABSE43_14295 [Steroidobacteraceae bacterium]|jgi:hypothetical protein